MYRGWDAGREEPQSGDNAVLDYPDDTVQHRDMGAIAAMEPCKYYDDGYCTCDNCPACGGCCPLDVVDDPEWDWCICYERGAEA